MYFIFNKHLSSFYGMGNVWIPKSRAKINQNALCVFADMYEAKECCLSGGLRGSGIMILNEKSAKTKLGVKKISSKVHPNWRMNMELINDAEEPEPETAQDTENNDCSAYEDDSDNVIHEKKAMPLYLRDELPEGTLNSALIQDTLKFIEAAKDILDKWNDRMAHIEQEIRTYELRTSDELHLLEFSADLSQDEMRECAERLQQIRVERRITKNERYVGDMLLPLLNDGISTEKLQHLEKNIFEMQTRQYRIRVPEQFGKNNN